jgi:hypothetical protein
MLSSWRRFWHSRDEQTACRGEYLLGVNVALQYEQVRGSMVITR